MSLIVGSEMKNTLLLATLAVILGLFAFTNPDVDQYRGHVREQKGLAGSLGLLAADVLSNGTSKGIHRENFWLWSKFYLGGDGILPRQDLAWGALGKFWPIDPAKK